MTTLAIDIGGTKLAAALVKANGTLEITQRREIPTPSSRTPDELANALTKLTAPYKNQANCFAVASTGIIDDGILTALNPKNLGGLAQFPLINVLTKTTGLKGVAINDAQAAALAEYKRLDPSISDMVFITVSTGVGGGVISKGSLLTGRGGIAGHIGHMLADPNGPTCGCQRRGCVEAIASGLGISNAAKGELTGKTAKEIFAHASAGNEQAKQLIACSAQTIARLVADMKIMTDCQCVVIGGGVGLAAGYIDQVKAFLQDEPPTYHTEIHRAYHQENAGLFGAALWAQATMETA